MKLEGHGVAVELPDGWEGRIVRRDDAGPVMHVATFPLLASDGDFGAAATGRMRPGDMFGALLEYVAPGQIKPGVGLFAEHGVPPRLRAHDFKAMQLQVTRRGQFGWQRFFTESGRTCCLYAVIRPRFGEREVLARDLGKVLSTIRIKPAAARREK